MTEGCMAAGVLAIAWLGAIQGDRHMFGLPVWDGTLTSLVKPPATPIHPSKALYSAREARSGHAFSSGSHSATYIESSSATSASSSSRFDWNSFDKNLYLLFVAIFSLTVILRLLYLFHQYCIREAFGAQSAKWSEEKKTLRTDIAYWEEINSDMQDSFRQRVQEEVDLQLKTARAQDLPVLVQQSMDVISGIDGDGNWVRSHLDNLNSRLAYQDKQVDYLTSRVRELESIPGDDDLRAENLRLRLIVNGGVPERGLNPHNLSAEVYNLPRASAAASAKSSPHWHQQVKINPRDVALPPQSPASTSKHPAWKACRRSMYENPTSTSALFNSPHGAAAGKDVSKPSQPPIPVLPSPTAAVLNAEKLALLREQGIGAPQARKALGETNGDVVDAMKWAYDHPEDLGNLAEYDDNDDSSAVSGVGNDATKDPIRALPVPSLIAGESKRSENLLEREPKHGKIGGEKRDICGDGDASKNTFGRGIDLINGDTPMTSTPKPDKVDESNDKSRSSSISDIKQQISTSPTASTPSQQADKRILKRRFSTSSIPASSTSPIRGTPSNMQGSHAPAKQPLATNKGWSKPPSNSQPLPTRLPMPTTGRPSRTYLPAIPIYKTEQPSDKSILSRQSLSIGSAQREQGNGQRHDKSIVSGRCLSVGSISQAHHMSLLPGQGRPALKNEGEMTGDEDAKGRKPASQNHAEQKASIEDGGGRKSPIEKGGEDHDKLLKEEDEQRTPSDGGIKQQVSGEDNKVQNLSGNDVAGEKPPRGEGVEDEVPGEDDEEAPDEEGEGQATPSLHGGKRKRRRKKRTGRPRPDLSETASTATQSDIASTQPDDNAEAEPLTAEEKQQKELARRAAQSLRELTKHAENVAREKAEKDAKDAKQDGARTHQEPVGASDTNSFTHILPKRDLACRRCKQELPSYRGLQAHLKSCTAKPQATNSASGWPSGIPTAFTPARGRFSRG